MGQTEHRAYVKMKNLQDKIKCRPWDKELSEDYNSSIINHERARHEDEMEELKILQSAKYHY